MGKCLVLIVFFAMPFLIKAQTNLDSLLTDIESQNKEVFYSRVYTITNKKNQIASPGSKVYQSQGMFHSDYIILNPDSTFVYYSVFEVGFDLTVGKWSQLNADTLSLNWDKQKTREYVNDKKKYKRYFEHSSPNAAPMTNWLIRRTAEKLEPIK